jgi:hypothetical protein
MDLISALSYYNVTPTDDRGTDLVAAAREAARRRKEGPEATAEILAALHNDFGLTFVEIELASYDEKTGTRISRATAERLVNRRGT